MVAEKDDGLVSPTTTAGGYMLNKNLGKTNCLTSVPNNIKLEHTYGAWTQPVFSSNTNGVLTLSASHESQPAWYAFNGDKTTNDNCWWTSHGVTSTSNPCWIQLKSQIKLKLNQVVIRNEHQSPENFKTAYLQVSNDGSNWTNIATINGTNTGGYETTVNFTVNDGYYYYRLYFTESYSTGGVSIQTLTFSGTAQNTLTLKAGSKVYVPNGAGKFDAVTVASDITFPAYSYSGQSLICVKGTRGEPAALTSQASGASNPSTRYSFWYDTTNNLVKFSTNQNGTFDAGGWSLPIALVTRASGKYTSIDQIFDWCGFIGSHQFFLPGIKGLKSNGFKADGTYNNIECETKSVLLNQYTYKATNQQVFISNKGVGFTRNAHYYSQATAPAVATYSIWHNTKDNFIYYIGADTSTGWVKDNIIGFPAITNISTDSSYKITSLTPATVKITTDFKRHLLNHNGTYYMLRH